MFPGLTEHGVVEYNSFTFRGAFRIELNGRDVYDRSGRSVQWTEYTLDVYFILADDGINGVNTVDLSMSTIHALLSQPGQALRISNKGFGATIQVGGHYLRDVNFGPKPQIRTWKPLGSSLAVQVHWQCTFALKECAQQISNVRGVLAINYALDIDIDRHGNTTRTINGVIVVVNNRIGRALTESPEAWRKAIAAPVPPGFSRQQRYHFNEAKNEITFTIVDTEIQTHHNAFPPLMVEADGEHTVDWNRSGHPGRLNHSLSLKLVPRANISQVECWLIGLSILKKRLAIQTAATDCDGNKSSVILTSFRIREDLWGRPVAMSFNWVQLHSLKKIIEDTGLFTSLYPASQWDQWRTSMADWAHHPNGNAKWNMLRTDDAVIDLCSANQQGTFVINDAVASYPILATQTKGYQNKQPDPQSSYLSYQQAIIPTHDRPTVQQEILQATELASGSQDMLESENPDYGQPSGYDSIIQQAGRSRYEIILAGSARRAGHPVPKPKLVTVGSQPAIEVGGSFVNRIVYNALGVPVYGAQWLLRFVLKNSPTHVLPKANVQQKVKDDGTACKPTE